MSQKLKTYNHSEAACEKYLNKVLRQEHYFTTKKSPAPKIYQEKLSHVLKPVPQPVGSKQKSNFRQTSPLQRGTPPVTTSSKDQGDVKEVYKNRKAVERPRSRSRSRNKDRESWGQLLQTNKSREQVSSFSNFDPLRTLHFLSKELRTKLEGIIPGNHDVFQMISDIHHALKRIPPEVSTLLHNQHNDFSQSEISGCAIKNTSNRSCQTPPTMYQEDTEKFQKIMEENTYKLEASCKQLEMVCSNLQKEKELTEKDLDEARENVELLCMRVKELESEMEEVSNMKIRHLEEERQHLQEELEKAIEEINTNPTAKQLRKLVDELKKQKLEKEEICAKMECQMTLLKMEKEKYVTMLAVRDREVKNIQDEMSKIQEQVTKQLSKLNSDVARKSSSLKIIPDQDSVGPENMFLEIGDTTISSITTNESEKEPIHLIKSHSDPQGDNKIEELKKKSEDNIEEKFEVEKDLPSSSDRQIAFKEMLEGLTPSMQALLISHNV